MVIIVDRGCRIGDYSSSAVNIDPSHGQSTSKHRRRRTTGAVFK